MGRKPRHFGNSFGGRTRETTVCEWIRDYLRTHGDEYVRELHRQYCEWAETNGHNTPTYDSFRQRVYMLRRLDLVEISRKEPVEENSAFKRHYHRIAPGANLDHEGWTDPTKELYGR